MQSPRVELQRPMTVTPSLRVEFKTPTNTTEPPRVNDTKQPSTTIPTLPPIVPQQLHAPVTSFSPNLSRIPRPVTPQITTPIQHHANQYQVPLQNPTQPSLVPRSPLPHMNFSRIHPFTYNPMRVVNHIFDDSGKKLRIDALLQGPMKETWRKSMSNELARLSDSIPGRVRGTKAVKWIHKQDVPRNKKLTYAAC